MPEVVVLGNLSTHCWEKLLSLIEGKIWAGGLCRSRYFFFSSFSFELLLDNCTIFHRSTNMKVKVTLFFKEFKECFFFKEFKVICFFKDLRQTIEILNLRQDLGCIPENWYICISEKIPPCNWLRDIQKSLQC